MKLNKKQALKILHEFQKELEKLGWYKLIKPELKASLLYGSVAKGTNTPDSDIDMLLIVPLEIEEKYTKGEYFYQFKDAEINIVLRSIERLRVIAKAPDSTQREVFRNAVLISESDGEVKKLLREIALPRA